MTECDIAVVGSGPGGLAAAVEAAALGAFVTVLDENSQPGGQIYRPLLSGQEKLVGRGHRRRVQWLTDGLERFGHRIEILDEAAVWGAFDPRSLTYSREGKSHELSCRKLILATGAYDRPAIFPGWTLPGVFTVGGAQRLLKDHGILPGQRILLAGCGPLQLALAKQILDAGGRIVALLEVANILAGSRLLPGLVKNSELFGEAATYLTALARAGVRVRPHHTILKVRGNGKVEEAAVTKVDAHWRPLPGKVEWFSVDAVCLGYGFLPSNEMARLLGASGNYSRRTDTFVLNRSPHMETTVPGVFAVGDGVVSSGAHAAWLEGRIAGVRAATDLGFHPPAPVGSTMASCQTRLKKLASFQQILREISRPGPGFYELADRSTIVCRCEEITLGEILDRISDGVEDIRQLKRFTRAGMGACQGRICGHYINHIIRQKTGREAKDQLLPPRPPLKPVRLEWLEGL